MASATSVRVSIPVSVASDIKSFKKAVGGILDKLGCQACCSGNDIFFELQRSFVFEDDVKIRGLSALSRTKPDESASGGISATLSPKVADKIDHVFTAIDEIAKVLGCPACCSGHDLRFSLERHLLMDGKLNIKEQAFAIG
jgi:hypothetical protein